MSPADSESNQRLIDALESVRRRCIKLEREQHATLAACAEEERPSARNLLHYLGLRQGDLRAVQAELAQRGLSRLARCEASTLASLDAVLNVLLMLSGKPGKRRRTHAPLSLAEGRERVKEKAVQLLGPTPSSQSTRIMVTMPSEAADRPDLIRDLLAAGMDIMRINCAHDGPEAWHSMVRHLREAERALGCTCKVYADLAGPKLRTGAIQSLGRVVDFAPRRDFCGKVLEPAPVWLTDRNRLHPSPVAGATLLPLSRHMLASLQEGDRLELEDCRGGKRSITVKSRSKQGCLAEAQRHIYLHEGAACTVQKQHETLRDNIYPLPELPGYLLLKPGERLILTPQGKPGHPAQGTTPAHLPCTLDAVFASAQPDEAIWFDDGRIGGRILGKHADGLEVEITHAPAQGARLRAEKGINLPDTRLDIPALTDKDLADLRTMAPLVDLIGLSFVRSADDITHLHQALHALKADHLGCILKIETRLGFENLPRILLASLQRPPVGVMVARGDLAVEVGFERLAELQEEILWLCEAAHVPVIWATQVLENMAQRGMPSRAEVSDAALAIRAECVMLNKGPHIVETVEFLSGILTRMSGHNDKRRPVMRKLTVSDL